MKLGVDTGGTFTDFILKVGDELKRYKCSSTPADPSVAILQGIHHFFPGGIPTGLEIVHGTTVGTNAFLERKGGRPLLITTKGFEDVLAIGRQQRASLFDLGVSRPLPVVDASLIHGVCERIDAKGQVVTAILDSDLAKVRELISQFQADTVVICFLNSFLNDVHERYVQQLLADLGIPILCSVDILPEFREFERCSTALINGYLAPVMADYIETLTARIGGSLLSIQQSNGGVMAAASVRMRAVHTLLSGPAAGVQGAYQLAQKKAQRRFITFDMGGTSTDVFLSDGHLSHTKEYVLDGYPIAIPMLDIHTVGAGGGSIAYIDQAGVLRVGPLSAGADPGPVCYGKGEMLTVTDANLLLGRLLPDAFLGGRMRLDIDRSQRFAEIMAQEIGVSVLELCLGIITIVTAEMVKAVRTVSLDRGHDPADFTLYSFGGSSGLHCCDLATDLGLNTIEIPARGGVLSAQGLVFATPLLDQTKGLFLQAEACTYEGIRQECQKVEIEVCEKLRSMVVGGELFCRSYADMRYVGQSYEIAVAVVPDMEQEFHARHKQLFGYDLPDRPLECVSIRSVAQKETAEMELPKVTLAGGDPSPRQALVAVASGIQEIAVYKPADLPKQGVDGPCLIVDDYTTILVTESFSIQPDEYGGLILKKENKL